MRRRFEAIRLYLAALLMTIIVVSVLVGLEGLPAWVGVLAAVAITGLILWTTWEG